MKREINNAAHKLRRINAQIAELESQKRELENLLKAEMTATGTDELNGSDWKATWHKIETSRFDTTAFKKASPEMYQRFCKSSTTRRFLIA